MPHSFGYRARTRDMFSVAPKQKGRMPAKVYMQNYHLGDYVDIVGNGAVHGGMPHKFYHGKTGVVWNVTKRAVGVIVNKQVRGSIMPKKIHVRIEHVRPSRCQEELKKRIARNDNARRISKENGKRVAGVAFKRKPQAPRKARVVNMADSQMELLCPETFISYYV